MKETDEIKEWKELGKLLYNFLLVISMIIGVISFGICSSDKNIYGMTLFGFLTVFTLLLRIEFKILSKK